MTNPTPPLTFKNWRLYDVMPDGWKVCKTAGSPLFGYVFITNGKSVLNGGQMALLSINALPTGPLKDYAFRPSEAQLKIEQPNSDIKKPEIDENYRKTLNDLARATFQENLLKDILIDLEICALEGWSKDTYINSLKELIGSICNKDPNS